MTEDSIARRLEAVRSTLRDGVKLCAVSKFHPVEALREAYEAGQRVFGESRVMELLDKEAQLPSDIEWHFIGHLQTNKVRKLIGRTAMIESVDSERLLRLIDAESERAGVTTRVLVQVHVAMEETKFGMSPDELIEFFARGGHRSLRVTHICGIMGMASNVDNPERWKADFRAIADTARAIREAAPDLRGFDTVSMGMSHDYREAMECGATIVRVGSAIFGAR